MRGRPLLLAALALAIPLVAGAEEGGLAYEAGISLSAMAGPSLRSDLRYRWPEGFALGLSALIPASSLTLAFPVDAEADGARTEGFRAFDADWGLYAAWVPESPRRTFAGRLGLAFGGLASYRSGRYEDEVAGIEADYAKWTWLKELRLEGAASLSVGGLLGIPPLRRLRLGISGGLPLRSLLYASARFALGLDLSWAFADARGE